MIDGLVLLLCAVAAVMGWRRGALLTALPAAALVTGYAAAVFLYEPVGEFLMAATGIPPLPAYVIGGVLAVVATAVLFRGVGWWLRRQRSRPTIEFFEEDRAEDDTGEPVRRPRPGPSPASRYGGAVLGAAWAFGVAMILVWGVESVAAFNDAALDAQSFTGAVGGRAVGGVAGVLVERKTGDDFTATTAEALLRDPAAFSELTDELFANDDFRRLVSDPGLPELLARGRVDELARRPELQRLLQDPDFLRLARRLGVTDGADIESPEQMARSLTRALGPVASAVTSLREDAEIMETVRRLDLAERLDTGNVMALLRDRDLAAVAGRVLEALGRRGR